MKRRRQHETLKGDIKQDALKGDTKRRHEKEILKGDIKKEDTKLIH